MRSGKSSILNGLWLMACFYLSFIGNYLFPISHHQSFFGGEYYIIFILLYSLFTYILTKNWVDLPKFNSWIFIIGAVALIFSQPLYENDHYRYLWEGKVFLELNNPYVLSPNSSELSGIFFKFKERIGFPALTTIYPPLSLIWFGIGGVFGQEWGLKILMLLNFFLLYKFYEKLKLKVRPLFLVMLMPIILKEFIQAIHIDFLAAYFFFLFLLKPTKKFISLILSFNIKYLSAIGFLGYFKERRKFNLKEMILILLLPLSLYFLTNGFTSNEGAQAFANTWVWSPGFYGVISYFFNYDHFLSRYLCLGIFAVYSLILVVLYRRNLTCPDFYFYFFAGMMFFSPVYNGWYVIWIILPGLLMNNKRVLLYGVSSVFCYIYYWNPDWVLLGRVLTHFPFFFVMKDLLYLALEQLAPPRTQNCAQNG
ncbi:MAG: hypothetical protein GY909_02885 [Oligoflexia bacterium]|nr:hypothetical protein [Oligoflexia bacterium]